MISTYLLPEMNQKLRPKILNLKPGTRVVAHDYHMGDWLPDQDKEIIVPEKTVGTPGRSYIYLWIVPAKIGGRWQAQIKSPAHPGNLELEFGQRFQKLEGTATSGGQKAALFQGEMLRGTLLNSWGWWTVGVYTAYAAVGLMIAALVALGALVYELFIAGRKPETLKVAQKIAA